MYNHTAGPTNFRQDSHFIDTHILEYGIVQGLVRIIPASVVVQLRRNTITNRNLLQYVTTGLGLKFYVSADWFRPERDKGRLSSRPRPPLFHDLPVASLGQFTYRKLHRTNRLLDTTMGVLGPIVHASTGRLIPARRMVVPQVTFIRD